MFLKPVEEKEILDIVKGCKNKTSTDYHDMDMKTLKTVIESISKPLTYICNLSLQTGQFPDGMKVAKVIPLFKAGDKHLFTNYRPVSLLPQFSKILEKVYNSRLDSFIERCNLLSDNQFGFRNNHSTSHALFDIIEEITNAVDNKKYAIGLFIDLSKAFDTINYDILINKLEHYGIRGVALQWVTSYLKNRKQCVKIGDYQSSCRQIVCGLPQGSILGPKLFNMYINDICKTSQVLKFILFADDTNIFASGDDLQQLCRIVNLELKSVNKWFKQNKLSLNLSKSKMMIFGNCNSNAQEAIQIEGVVIERVHEIKFLGVIIDDRITWKAHIKYISTKISRSISVIAKAKHILNIKALHILYCSLILPYLYYCTVVWGSTYKNTLKPIVLLQKRAIRVIHKVGFLDHTNSLFLKSKIMKFCDIVEFQTVQMLYKARYKLLPGQIQRRFQERTGCYELRDELNFRTQKHSSTLKSFSPTVNGVQLWNKLEMELKRSPNINLFKYKYKQKTFEIYREQEMCYH
uniref:Reverse transcriptase domain-containing protein n=1 Tax=Neogobius melanostomus TaxID=47308 RepID=A0A8C6SQ40_9GOBI